MSQIKTTLNYLCHLAENEINQSFPNLNVISIIHNNHDFQKVLEAQKEGILKLGKGHDAYDALLSYKPDKSRDISFKILTAKTPPKFWGLFGNQKSIAALLINTETLTDEDIAKFELYKNVYMLLKEHENIGHITDNEAYNNMIGDAFIVFFSEITSRHGMIKSLAKKRCLQSIQKTINYTPELMPYPAIMDMTALVWKDAKRTKNISPMRHALELTAEVEQTCDENIVNQWQEFITPATEMAWCNATPSEILGAAIHTSESVSTRSIAYLISDIINTTPAPLNALPDFNAFTDTDAQQRLHMRISTEKFEKINAEPLNHEQNIYIEAALSQSEKFLDGNLMGWSAPILIEIGIATNDILDLSKRRQMAETIFTKKIESMPWQRIKILNKHLLEIKRKGLSPTLNDIMEFLRQTEDTRDAAIAIKHLIDYKENKKAGL